MTYESLYQAKPREYFQGAFDELLQYVPDDIQLALDVGCATGEFGAKLKRRGIKVWGIEPNVAAADQAKNKLDAVVNDVFSIQAVSQFGEMRFDCVFFVDVLEHMVDPESALEVCKGILKPGGYVVSAIPNILQYGNILRILSRQDWEYTESGIMDRTHLRFFTRKSIERMFKSCGFAPQRLEGYFKTYSRKFALFNLLTMFCYDDMKFSHFIIVARYE